MKIKIIGVIASILVFCFAPFSIIASANVIEDIEKIQVVDYDKYISNIVIDNETDTITCFLSLHDIITEWVYQTTDGHVIETGRNDFNSSNIYASHSEEKAEFITTFYLLGEKYIDATYIPSGTEFTFNIKSWTNAVNPNGQSVGRGCAMVASINNQNNVTNWNQGEYYNIPFYTETTIKTTFNKRNDSSYMSPIVQIKHAPINDTIIECVLFDTEMTFNLKNALLEQQQSNKTNQMLQYIVESNPDIEKRVEEIEKELAEKTEEADKIQEELENLYKPNVESLVGDTDTFEIVDGDDVGEYTDIFGAILDSDIVKNMMLCCVGIALLSLVLFGKKG